MAEEPRALKSFKVIQPEKLYIRMNSFRNETKGFFKEKDK